MTVTRKRETAAMLALSLRSLKRLSSCARGDHDLVLQRPLAETTVPNTESKSGLNEHEIRVTLSWFMALEGCCGKAGAVQTHTSSLYREISCPLTLVLSKQDNKQDDVRTRAPVPYAAPRLLPPRVRCPRTLYSEALTSNCANPDKRGAEITPALDFQLPDLHLYLRRSGAASSLSLSLSPASLCRWRFSPLSSSLLGNPSPA